MKKNCLTNAFTIATLKNHQIQVMDIAYYYFFFFNFSTLESNFAYLRSLNIAWQPENRG